MPPLRLLLRLLLLLRQFLLLRRLLLGTAGRHSTADTVAAGLRIRPLLWRQLPP